MISIEKMCKLVLVSALCVQGYVNACQIDYSPANTVMVFDLDDVMSKSKPCNKYSIGNGIKTVLRKPSLLFKVGKIKRTYKALKKEIENGVAHGTASITCELAQKYGGRRTVRSLDSMLSSCIRPQPIVEMLNTARDLRSKGYTVLFATNQDQVIHGMYRQSMKEQGYDFDQLFDGGMVVAVPDQVKKHFSCRSVGKDIRCVPLKKPDAGYYQEMRNMVDKKQPGAKIVFFDDRLENVAAIKHAGKNTLGIHVVTPQDVRAQLASHGIL